MNICVVGLQWGDEGKGKVVDILAEHSDIVVRYNGGSNAGHTVVVDDTKFALHLLPSGSVRPNVICVITNAVVVDPDILITEIETLARKGITLKDRLLISENAHVVLDYHKKEDQLREESLGKKKLGTTIRGIGPCYADKAGRSHAIRMCDLRNLEELKAKLQTIVEYKNKVFAAVYPGYSMLDTRYSTRIENRESRIEINADEIFEKCKSYADKLMPYLIDTTEFLHKSIADGKSILFEGAQGSLLDLDHGTFPYVTSSNASALGMPAGSGVPAKMVDKFIGVAKAYTTRVGAGPFPTEQDNEIGQYIRDRGNEYGTTTGRPRRCGWFDAVAVLYAAKIGAIDAIALMHLDTLAGLKEVKICTAYSIERSNGCGCETRDGYVIRNTLDDTRSATDKRITKWFPTDIEKLSKIEPIYETIPGWDEDITKANDFHELPLNAQNYICQIEKHTGKPITIIGVGPERNQTIFR